MLRRCWRLRSTIFQPKTGEELKPITRQVANAWKAQNEKVVRRAAALVADPDKYGFFDPVTGPQRFGTGAPTTEAMSSMMARAFSPELGIRRK
jgi:hypothetical protein